MMDRPSLSARRIVVIITTIYVGYEFYILMFNLVDRIEDKNCLL
jgi:hypothetical protein